ncbi:MAG: autotransporter outer membrane beta-barrel domain-containing protein [Desulfococcaceae bacterium]
MRRKRVWVWTIVGILCLGLAGPVLAQEGGALTEDITEEVLTGPSDLDPEKILGPGSVSISTHEDILMSFGATVRFVPTAESDWDFGLSDEVPGYFNTRPIKDFSGSALTGMTALKDVFDASRTFDAAAAPNGGTGDIAVIESYSNFADSFLHLKTVSPTPETVASADAVNQIRDVAHQTGNDAEAAFNQGVLQSGGDPNGGLAALNQAAAQAGQVVQQLQQALAADPTSQTLQQQLLGAAGVASGFQAAAAAVAADNSAAADVGAIANATALETMADQAELVEGVDETAEERVKLVLRDPNATSDDITASVAYLTGLKARAEGFNSYALAETFLKTHSNESGNVNDGYIRNETKLYFNAMPKNKKWSFYSALEFDRPIDTETVDNRGGRSDGSSTFGLERLNASIELVDGLRLHGGWDVWGLDIIEAASMVYGDDNPGFWLKGNYDDFNFSLAWLKLEENDFQNEASDHDGAVDSDRDLLAGYVDYLFRENDKVRFFYGWDRIRNVPSLDLTGAIAAQQGLAQLGVAGIYGNNGRVEGITGTEATNADTDAHTIGGYYLGHFGILELMVEGAYKYGEAKNTGLKGVDNGEFVIQYDDFDISAYAFSADVGLELKELVGWESLKPRLGFMYTSGDDNPGDDELGGFTGITAAQRFSRAWGGENTIIGDTNFVLGTGLYGYIPEFYGNGTPAFTGGIQNFAGTGNGRGDNPGLTMISAGLTLRPRIYLIYRTNVNYFRWNEDFSVANMVDPITITPEGALAKSRYTAVESGYVGTEWDNEITLALSKHMFVKGQFSFFFPGEAIEDVTRALSGGTETDEVATRLAMELIWNF